jgi:exodeoxyribonuclease-3
MKFASFNVNSIRARRDIVLNWLESQSPDVLAVQETKVQDKDFPLSDFESSGYNCIYKGQKSYNGVAVFSKQTPEQVGYGLGGDREEEARFIKARIGGVWVVNTYVPQGRDVGTKFFRYKLDWLTRLKRYFEANFQKTDPVLWVGDLNTARDGRDVYDPEGLQGHVCFNEQLTEKLEDVMEWGFTDLFRYFCEQDGCYSFWDYRMPSAVKSNRGWRLDYIMVTKPLLKTAENCYIDKVPRLMKKPSDHTPVVAEFDL